MVCGVSTPVHRCLRGRAGDGPGAGLTEDQVSLMTEEDGGYQLKFKAVELWERLKAALE